MVSSSYSMPFLWVADNNYEVIGKEIEKIRESGSHRFCVESRTHEDFCGKKWWELMDFIISKAEKLGMRVWLLDDKHYPTGYANGAVERRPELRQIHLKAVNIDIAGPIKNGKLLLFPKDERKDGERIVSVALLQRQSDEKFLLIDDLIDNVQGDFVKFTLPTGHYRVSIVTSCVEYDNWELMIDMMNPKSVQLLIDEVYEPHYARYQNTCFEGFFSDEPGMQNGFSNERFPHSLYGGRLGVQGLTYPWNDDILEELSQNLKGFQSAWLSALWNHIDNIMPEVRVAYMDSVTKRYGKNFSGRLSEWCHKRGLKYASHIIEDMGAHARTNNSAGHYFRSQQGADYAGVDVVLHQIKPYFNREKHIAPIGDGYADPKFFNNTLAKLASSCARIYPEKQGRALCEIFGAYGWAESSFEMLWLANHMIARGINRFIPHAFSTIFPNDDCPPFFYAAGTNPNFDTYQIINTYMGKICSLFEGGETVCGTAVLYHAEAEWSGLKMMPVDDVAEVLLENQIDFDIIPEDVLQETDGRLQVNNRYYHTLIVPYREYLPEKLLLQLENISSGTKVLFVDIDVSEYTRISLEELNKYFDDNQKKDAEFISAQRDLRVRHLINHDKDFYFFHNESQKTITTQWICKGDYQSVFVHDILNDRTEVIPVDNGMINITLYPGQAYIYELSQSHVNAKSKQCKSGKLADATGFCYRYERGEQKEIEKLDFEDLLKDEIDFSGIVEISAMLDLNGVKTLYIEFSGEKLTVMIGDQTFSRVFSPAVIDLDYEYGKESVILKLNNTLTDEIKDIFSQYSVLEPLSIGEINFYYEGDE